jgi:S1-C subfamily serine protease
MKSIHVTLIKSLYAVAFALPLVFSLVLYGEETTALDKLMAEASALEATVTQQKVDLLNAVKKSKQYVVTSDAAEQAYTDAKISKEQYEKSNNELSALKSQVKIECKKQAGILVASENFDSYRKACMMLHHYAGPKEALELVRKLGEKLESQNQYQNAATLYKQFSVLDESLLVLHTRASQKTAGVTEAQQCEEAGDYSKALKIYQTLALPSDVKRVAEKQARRLEKNGKYAQAVRAYEAAGLLSEARRVRENNMVDESTIVANSSDVYESIAPAVVTVIFDKSFGTGFFVKAGGYIVTNNHVIDGTTIKVRIADKKEYSATLIFKSETPDIAIIKIASENHPVVLLGDSDTVKAGQTVSAIGTPFDEYLAGTLTQGVISATDRKIFGNTVFQVDAAINKGNSGGALIDEHGKVIGVNTFGLGVAKQSSQGTIGSGVEGINFAIKINEVKPLLSAHIPNSL